MPYTSSIAPSSRLAAIVKLSAAFRDKPAAESFSEVALPIVRPFLNKFYAVYLGELEVTPTPAEDLKTEYGVDAQWVSWPGVDTSSAAPTILHFHGGESRSSFVNTLASKTDTHGLFGCMISLAMRNCTCDGYVKLCCA